MSGTNEPTGFDALPVDEKIDIVQRLWDRIASGPDQLPLPDWHLEVVRERLAAHRDRPDEELTWPEVRDQVERSIRNQKR